MAGREQPGNRPRPSGPADRSRRSFQSGASAASRRCRCPTQSRQPFAERRPGRRSDPPSPGCGTGQSRRRRIPLSPGHRAGDARRKGAGGHPINSRRPCASNPIIRGPPIAWAKRCSICITRLRLFLRSKMRCAWNLRRPTAGRPSASAWPACTAPQRRFQYSHRRSGSILPRLPEAHRNLGVALATSDRWNEAIAEFSQAVRLRPDYADAHFRLALALWQVGRREDALAERATALRLNPTLPR